MTTASEWFRPASSRVPVGGPFLARARGLAPAALGCLVPARATGSCPVRWIGDDPGVALTVVVPGFDDDPVHLRVALHGGRLTGCWSRGTPAVDRAAARGPDVLVADAVPGQEADVAEVAVHWLAGQLTRPVREERWVGWRGTIASRTVMADTDGVLWERGVRVIRRHGLPSQVLQVRPCAEASPAPGRRTTKGA